MSNTRNITAIVAFIVTFIFSAGLVRIIFPAPVVQYVYINRPQYTNPSSNEIESFLLRDIRNGETRMDRISSLRDSDNDLYAAEFAGAVMEYSRTSSSMDSSRFPQDFQDAWQNHMKAWRGYAEFLDEMKTPSARKNMSDADYRNSESRYNAEINRTWYEVTRLARNYGADVD